MNRRHIRHWLEQGLAELSSARQHLDYSFRQVAGLSETMIAHDYAGAKVAEIFSYCREYKPVLDRVCDQTVMYAQRVLSAHD